MLLGHLLVSDGDVQVGNFLKLPFDGGSHIIDLLLKGLVVSNWLWEFTDSVKNWTENLWDLLDEVVSGEEKIVLLGPLLNLFLVLVEFLQAIKGDNFNLEIVVGALIEMLNIGNKADLKVWSWDMGKSDGSNETLILLGVIILKGNLHLNSLSVLSFLGGELCTLGSHVGLLDLVLGNFRCGHVLKSLIRSLHLAIGDEGLDDGSSGGLGFHLCDALEYELVGDLGHFLEKIN